MGKISCEIIKDLLPLYHDEVCSQDSVAMVEEHLAVCNNCQLELIKIKSTISLPNEIVVKNHSDGNAIKGISVSWSHSKVKAFVKGLIVATLLSITVFGGYVGLFKWNLMKVSADVVKITDVSRLSDGSIAYHIKLTDGYNLNRIKYEMDENGIFYLTPTRPIVRSKAKVDVGLHNMYFTFGKIENNVYHDKYGSETKIKALYFRTADNDILIWKEGMDLPTANAQVEAMFTEKTN